MREPTIFSSDSPRSSSEGPPNWRNRWPKVLDVDLLTDWPLDEDMSEDDKQAFLLYVENVRACAAIQDMALTLLHGENAFSKWQPSERRCLVATLHRICASKDRARFEWALKTATDEQRARVEYARKAYEQNVNVAQRFVDESCRPRSAYSQRVMDVFNSVALRWETFDWRWPTPK